MSYSRLFRLGTSDFPLGTSVSQIEKGRTIGSAKLARAHGMRQTSGYHNGVKIELSVPLIKGPLDISLVRPRIDAVRTILDQGPANLYLEDDRYWRCCECETEPNIVSSETGYGRIHALRCSLIGPDDVQFGTDSEGDTWTPANAGTHNLSPSGNADTYPTFSITVGGSGLETIAFTVTNNTTEEEFTLAGDVTAGDVIVVNCLRKTVTIGDDDYLSLFDGIFLKLKRDEVNEIETGWSSSSMTAISESHYPRWL